ncbi:methyltransferase domain-containing protein [Falsiroseomonas stagni]|nr:methyltransferase domain-containing protein [Falsiroseomonas stagni]
MDMGRIAYRCPATREALATGPDGLFRRDGALYRFLPRAQADSVPVPNFLDLAAAGDGQRASLSMYDTATATAVYRNFLDWLFATFGEDEAAWRRAMVARLALRAGDAVLVTGCGLGDDIPPIMDAVGAGGEVHAQDLSPAMVQAAAGQWARAGGMQPRFSVGDAARLPFADGAFDAAFHFGGINLFDDIAGGIAEMARVVRPGGRVVLGDEGVAPWLRGTDYARMVIANIPLWGREAPIALLPPTARQVRLDWILGNCFWVISFTAGEGLPPINPHVPHKGRRGGTMWTRHHGVLEGVTPETRQRVESAAGAAGLSVHDWLEANLRARLAEAGDVQAGSAGDQPSSTAIPKPVRP